ncbi:MAG: lactate utilization protein [Candidatus Andersenbacteria bacterium]|nr:lactate utilization protein [Candidatus Andersenbacteria bacterium]
MNYETLATPEQITNTIKKLEEHNIHGVSVNTGAEALEKIKSMIPAGASVMNGSSVTLETIGFVDYLQAGQHGWNNLHEGILAEQDKAKQGELRKQASLSDFYLGSVHALSETGEFLVASNTGSQLPHIVFTSKNLIFVVGAQKLVPNLMEGLKRIEEYVVPLEDVHMMQKYGSGTSLNKIVMFKKENPNMGRNVTVIIVNEKLGY